MCPEGSVEEVAPQRSHIQMMAPVLGCVEEVHLCPRAGRTSSETVFLHARQKTLFLYPSEVQVGSTSAWAVGFAWLLASRSVSLPSDSLAPQPLQKVSPL